LQSVPRRGVNDDVPSSRCRRSLCGFSSSTERTYCSA